MHSSDSDSDLKRVPWSTDYPVGLEVRKLVLSFYMLVNLIVHNGLGSRLCTLFFSPNVVIRIRSLDHIVTCLVFIYLSIYPLIFFRRMKRK